jgi:SepF-like predicted cell division protein (DUF552 family)
MSLEALKKEAIKEFEDLERKTERGMWWVRLDRVQQIKDSLITKAYKEAEKEILVKISKIPKIEMTFTDIKEALKNNQYK